MNNSDTTQAEQLNETAVSSSYFDKEGWDNLKNDEGEGRECCGKNMVEIMNTYTCLKCGNWEYNSN